MKFRWYWLGWALWLLPASGWAFGGVGYVLQEMARVLLPLAAGAAGAAACFWGLAVLPKHLRKPEPTTPIGRQAAIRRIAGLTLPAAAAAWLTYDPHGSWYYPAVPLTLLLGLVACLLLKWRQRPTAANAMPRGLLVAGALTGLVRWLQLSAPKPPVPGAVPVSPKSLIPLGLLGNPIFEEAVFPADSIMATADTSHAYEYIEQMPGFRGSGTALKDLVNQLLHYPEAARHQGLTGIVQLSFVVQPDGCLTRAHLDAPLSAECDQEALRVLHLLAHHFSPGRQNGQPVPVQEILVFGFGPPGPASNQPPGSPDSIN